MSATTLPPTFRALVQDVYAEPLTVQELPTPQANLGSVVVKVASAGVISYSKDVYNGTRKYPYSNPIVPGTSAIGRVAAVGPDSTSLQVGQLVVIDPMIRSRDDPNDIILLGLVEGGTPGSTKLMRDVWRNGTYAEYVNAPLENCFPLDEKKLIGGLGYTEADLATLTRYAVPYGGLLDIKLQVGETVIVTPATGGFGSGAVAVALSMGANVIAMGRSDESLKSLITQFGGERVKTVKITNDENADMLALKEAAQGPIDCVFEISPPMAAQSNHIRSAILALRRGGRVSLMGGIMEDYAIPFRAIMRNDIKLQGKWMYEKEDTQKLIGLVEKGILKIGGLGGIKLVGSYGLEKWEEAFEVAAQHSEWNAAVVVVP